MQESFYLIKPKSIIERKIVMTVSTAAQVATVLRFFIASSGGTGGLSTSGKRSYGTVPQL